MSKEMVEKLEELIHFYTEAGKSFQRHMYKSSPQTDTAIKAINKRFDELKNDMNKGFDGVHERQDKTNGNVMKNTRWRLILNGGFIVTNIILVPVAVTVIIMLIKGQF